MIVTAVRVSRKRPKRLVSAKFLGTRVIDQRNSLTLGTVTLDYATKVPESDSPS